MREAVSPRQFEIGVVGLDPRGRRLARALAGHGLSVLACDGNAENMKALQDETTGTPLPIEPCLHQFISKLRPIRTILLGGVNTTAEWFQELLNKLEPKDLLIDLGNGHFRESERLAARLTACRIRYLGAALIGWDEELNQGLGVMVDGKPETYRSVSPILEMIAGSDGGEPWVHYLGAAPVGHFARMIHDGIEFGVMRVGLEICALLKHTLTLTDPELHSAIRSWPRQIMAGALCAEAACWTSALGREWDAPAPTLEAAAGVRRFSEFDRQNDIATASFRQPIGEFANDLESVLQEMKGAMDAAVLITYAEGLSVMAAGAQGCGICIDTSDILALWRKCHRSRAFLLEQIESVTRTAPELPNLLFDDDLSEQVMLQQEQLRHAVWRASSQHSAAPALAASLDYLDNCRGAWMPVNLIEPHPRRHEPPMPRRPADPAHHLPGTIPPSARPDRW